MNTTNRSFWWILNVLKILRWFSSILLAPSNQLDWYEHGVGLKRIQYVEFSVLSWHRHPPRIRRVCIFIPITQLWTIFPLFMCWIYSDAYSRLAGTTGAVVTCPLEVVKTRLQSSSNFGATRYDYMTRIATEDSGGSRMTCKTISSLQRRQYNTLSGAGGRHSSTQILTFSQCGVGGQTTKSMGLVQCLR